MAAPNALRPGRDKVVYQHLHPATEPPELEPEHAPAQYVYSIVYCMSKKSWPNLYGNLLFKMGQDFF